MSSKETGSSGSESGSEADMSKFRWLFCLANVFAYCTASYSEVSAFMNLYSSFSIGYLTSYHRGMIDIELFVLLISVILHMSVEHLIDKIDSDSSNAK